MEKYAQDGLCGSLMVGEMEVSRCELGGLVGRGGE